MNGNRTEEMDREELTWDTRGATPPFPNITNICIIIYIYIYSTQNKFIHHKSKLVPRIIKEKIKDRQ